MFNNLRADFARYTNNGTIPLKEKLYLFFEQGLWAVVVYRYGRWANSLKIPLLDLPFKLSAFFLHKMIEITTGISLPASAQIGKGLYIGHFHGIFVHSHVKMGQGCSIGPGVVIGTRGLGKKGVATIGDHVYIGVGAKIFGPIKIGNHVRIGANAVVLQDVPDHCTVVGVPGKIIARNAWD